MKKSLYILLVLLLILPACRKHVGPTALQVIDPVRHYYPIVQGEELRMTFPIVNVGKNPFIISDIQPASLSIELTKEAPKIIPAGDSLYLSLVYHSDYNIGFSEHAVRIFGNVDEVNDTTADGVVVVRFDTHIVRPSLDLSDYEERYWQRKAENEKLVDGKRGEQGYYTDEDKYDFL